MSSTKNKVFKFGIKNLAYSIWSGTAWGTPIPMAYAESISLEAGYSEAKLFGDGVLLAVLGTDKGLSGSIGVTNIEDHYEIALKRAMAIVGGTADIQQRRTIQHAIYYEVEALSVDKVITIKNWLFNCITGKPSETYEQTKEDPTINTYEYPLTVLGTVLRNSGDTADYVDSDGNTYKVYRLSAVPTDSGYATFGATVPVAKVKP